MMPHQFKQEMYNCNLYRFLYFYMCISGLRQDAFDVSMTDASLKYSAFFLKSHGVCFYADDAAAASGVGLMHAPQPQARGSSLLRDGCARASRQLRLQVHWQLQYKNDMP